MRENVKNTLTILFLTFLGVVRASLSDYFMSRYHRHDMSSYIYTYANLCICLRFNLCYALYTYQDIKHLYEVKKFSNKLYSQFLLFLFINQHTGLLISFNYPSYDVNTR